MFKTHQGETVGIQLTDLARRAAIFPAAEAKEWQDRIERVGFGAVAISTRGAENSTGYTLMLGHCFIASASFAAE